MLLLKGTLLFGRGMADAHLIVVLHHMRGTILFVSELLFALLN